MVSLVLCSFLLSVRTPATGDRGSLMNATDFQGQRQLTTLCIFLWF